MIELSFDGSDRRVILAMRARGPRLIAAEGRTLEGWLSSLQARIQQKLSGEVLQNRRGGGGLLGTVRKSPVMVAGRSIRGTVSAGGGLFWWAQVHELGGEETYPIDPGIVTGKSDKKALAFFPKGSTGAGLGRTALTKLRFALGHKRGELRPNQFEAFADAGGILRTHVEHPPLPKRPFMSTALGELRGNLIARVFETAARVLK